MPTTQDTKRQYKTFSEFKKRKKEAWIVEISNELMDINPYITSDDIAEHILKEYDVEITGKTVTRAFEEEEKRSNPLIDFTKKAGIGVGALGLLGNFTKIQDMSSDFVGQVLDNKVATGLSVGLASFWQGFVKPKINSPQNDLSELEVFTRLMDSQVGNITIGALISSITLPSLLEFIREQIDITTKRIGTGLSNIGKEVKDTFSSEDERVVNRQRLQEAPDNRFTVSFNTYLVRNDEQKRNLISVAQYNEDVNGLKLIENSNLNDLIQNYMNDEWGPFFRSIYVRNGGLAYNDVYVDGGFRDWTLEMFTYIDVDNKIGPTFGSSTFQSLWDANKDEIVESDNVIYDVTSEPVNLPEPTDPLQDEDEARRICEAAGGTWVNGECVL